MRMNKILFSILVAILIGTMIIISYIESKKALLSFDVDVRAYCPCDICTDGDGITADGSAVGGLGIASSVFDFGTLVRVEGYGIGVVNDRGPGVVEVYFDDHDVALEWGVRNIRVEVVR